MGWANCGDDSKGRPIGYAHGGRCDHDGCKTRIDRGLGYACGDMHGDSGEYCEGYFCGKHLMHHHSPMEGRAIQVCFKCHAALVEAYREDLMRIVTAFHIDLDDDVEMDEGGNEMISMALVDAVTEPGADKKMIALVYDVLTNWDDFYDLPIDGRYMHADQIEKSVSLAASRAEWARIAAEKDSTHVG